MSYNVFPQLSGITWNIKKRPTWNTTKMLTAGGNEFRTGYRKNPLTEFDLSYSYMSPTDKLSMEGFFNGQNGALTPFYFDLGVATNTASDNSVTAFTFGVGDGATTAFTLIKPAGTGAVEPVGGVNGTPLIYKSDWQGNQLQYATPRTNLFLQSENLAAAAWSSSQLTVGSAVAGPDGSTLDAFPLTANTGATNPVLGENFTWSNTTVTFSVWIKANTITHAMLQAYDNMLPGGLNGTATILSGPGTITGTQSPFNIDGLSTTQWTRVSITVNVVGNNHTITLYMQPRNLNYTVNAGDSIICSKPQAELNTIATSYIPTTTTTVTVTDYTLAGNQITFAVAPLLNAALTWTGNFYYLVRFSEDVLEFNQLMNQMYELQECKLVSVR